MSTHNHLHSIEDRVSSRWSHHTFCDYLRSTLLTLLTLSYEPYTRLPFPLFKTFNDSHQSNKIEDNRPDCYCHNEDRNTRRTTEGPRPLWRARSRTERLSYIPHQP